jgi:broad-specificity NMP kinase
MRLVFLYGPPGVGKLAVASELARRTNFKVFHNHMTINLAESVFARGTPAYSRLVLALRREVFAQAAEANVDLIFTFVYVHPKDDPLVRELIEPVVSRGGAVLFVQLTCALPTLFSRVQDTSRLAYRKITEAAELQDALQRYELFEAIPESNTLRLDTTSLSPAEAARLIVTHYMLPSPDPA